MKINWFKIVLKQEQDSQKVCDDFDSIILFKYPLIPGNSLLQSSNIYAMVDDEQTYHCAINEEALPLAEIFLRKYSASPCQKPNPEDVGHLWGDTNSLFYE